MLALALVALSRVWQENLRGFSAEVAIFNTPEIIKRTLKIGKCIGAKLKFVKINPAKYLKNNLHSTFWRDRSSESVKRGFLSQKQFRIHFMAAKKKIAKFLKSFSKFTINVKRINVLAGFNFLFISREGGAQNP